MTSAELPVGCPPGGAPSVHRSFVRGESLSGLDRHDIDDILAHAARFEDALRDARILVTGATGWFGTWILDALVALDRSCRLGLTILAVSRDPGAFERRHPSLHAASSIEWIEADVRDPLDDVAGPITHIIHAATDSSAKAGGDPSDRLFETIVAGTRNVLKLAARHPSSKTLLVSSGAVYGAQPNGLEAFAEDHRGAPDPLDPVSDYGEGKRAAEHLAALWHASHGVHVTIARCFAFVGPHMPFDAHFAIGNFIRDAGDGKPIRISGDGRPRRTYLYMSDLVVWLLAVLVDGRASRAYNVGGRDAITIAALAELCRSTMGSPEFTSLGRAFAGRDYVPDVSRATSELGLAIDVPLDEAIRRTASWRTRAFSSDACPERHAARAQG